MIALQLKSAALTATFLFAKPCFASEILTFTQAQQNSLGIQLENLKAGDSPQSPTFPGVIVVPVNQQRVLMSPQAGLVEEIHVAEGQTVKKGQCIAHVISPDMVHLQRDYLQLLSRFRLAENNLKRDEALHKQGIISQQLFQVSKGAYDEAHAELSHQQQELKLSGVEKNSLEKLDCASKIRSSIHLHAPFDGVLIEQLATVGQRVDSGTALFKVARLSPLWVEIRASLEALKDAKPGMAVRMEGVQAKVIHVMKNVNKQDQTMLVRAEIREGAERFAPGQFVQATLSIQSGSVAQWNVPAASVIRHQDKNFIFVQMAQGFKAVPVEVISRQIGRLVVQSIELTGREKVTSSGTAILKSAWLGAGE